MTNVFTYTDVVEPPTNVRATVLTPHSVEVTWGHPSSSGFTGYFISYTAFASYTSTGSATVGGSITSRTFINLEEGTPYTITVQATTSDNRRSADNNRVSVITYTDGKYT